MLVLILLTTPFRLQDLFEYFNYGLIPLSVLGGAAHGCIGALISKGSVSEESDGVLGVGSASIAGAIGGYLLVAHIFCLFIVREHFRSGEELLLERGCPSVRQRVWGRWKGMKGNYSSLSLPGILLMFTGSSNPEGTSLVARSPPSSHSSPKANGHLPGIFFVVSTLSGLPTVPIVSVICLPITAFDAPPSVCILPNGIA